MRNYALVNSWNSARERLALHEQYADPITRRRLKLVGLRRGWRCLDVGAGTGSIARWLCGKVGPSGHVLATDIDTRFLREIQAVNFETRQHDITTEELPEAAFDLICVRWLLHHLPEPERALVTMIKALRPGGTLLIEDADFFPVSASGSPLYVEFMLTLATTVVKASGGNCFWARGLPDLMTRYGFTDIGVDTDMAFLRGGSPRASFFYLTAVQMKERVLAAGGMTAERFDAGMELLQNPDFWAFAEAGIGVWGKTPQRIR